MSDTNIVVVKGNLTRDAELKYTTGGVAILHGSLANNEKFKTNGEQREHTNFFDFVMFGTRAEKLVSHFTKGTALVITGSLRQSRWEGDGGKRSKVEIQLDDFSFAGGKRDSGEAPWHGESQGNFNDNINDGPGDEGLPTKFEEDIPF